MNIMDLDFTVHEMAVLILAGSNYVLLCLP